MFFLIACRKSNGFAGNMQTPKFHLSNNQTINVTTGLAKASM